MPFEIIFFGLVLNYQVFYGKRVGKLLYLLCFIFSMFAKMGFAIISNNNFSVNVFLFLIVVLLMARKFSLNNFNIFSSVVLIAMLFVYYFAVTKNIFVSTHFQFINYGLFIFPILKVILKINFLNVMFLFCLLSEVINFCLIKNVVGFVNVLSYEVFYLILFALCVDVVFGHIIKFIRKKLVKKYV